MPVQDEYIFQIRIVTSMFYAKNGSINIVVRRPYAFLAKEISDVFTGQADVNVRVDRRYSDRRNQSASCLRERRRDERRQIKETLVDVVISE